MRERITENGIDYVLFGDYYIPDLRMPEENRLIGKYGFMCKECIKEIYPGRYTYLVLSGQLWIHFADVNEQAQTRLELIVKQKQESEGVTEELKVKDQWQWIRRMNSIRNRAEEIVLTEIVYR